MANNTLKSRIDPLLISLGQDQEIIQKTSRAIEIAKIILEEIGVLGIESPDEILYRILKLPNAERYDSWFAHHPYYASERACFAITDDATDTLEAKLYILKKKSRSMIAGAVNFTPNWEDADYTRDSSTARVGIDFFLTPTNSLIVALSNRGKLRIMELSDHISNTQVEIFATWRGAYNLSTREAIHTTLWEALKLESVNNKFFLGVAQSFTDLIQHLEKSGRHHEESKLFASRLHGRLLFVWFLRKKHIISERFDYFTTTDLSATEYYIKRLSPLFFECLNTPITERNTLDRDTPYLNGGLFDPKTDGYDWVASTLTFPEGFFDRLYTHFDQFNFTTDESTPDYEQIAIDPEMLGRIFENLLATQVEATGEQARKAKGAFYTPREIVSYMCRESLRQYLYTRFAKHESIDRLLDTSVSDWAKAGTNSRRDNYTSEEQRSIIGALDDITILDPACGSGAYPMGILQMMLQCYERLDTRYDPYQVKLQIIKNNLYGVDIEPMAVEIARLRAWLSLIVDEPSDSKNVKPLPNLDFKFVCANTLIPLASESGIFDKPGLKDEMKTLRDDYYSTTSRSKKESLKAKFEKLLDLGKGDGLFGSRQEQQLKSYHPFNVVSSCGFFDPEFMFGIEDGFDMVIGNPPYVQLQKFARTQMQKDLENVGYKTFGKTSDLYALFYERGLELTKAHTGVLSYITSNKWMRAGYGDKLRAYFSEKNPLVLIDCGPGIFESATVDTNIIMIQNAPNTDSLNALTLAKDDRGDIAGALRARGSHLPSPGSGPWFIGSPAEIALKAKIESIGKPLKEWDVKINYGIKTGLNEAFIIDRVTRDRLIAEDPKSIEIIKPILRGRDIKRYGYEFAELYVVATFPALHLDIENYPAIKKYLMEFGKDQLEQSGKDLGNGRKARKKNGNKWFETQDNIGYWNEFEKEKVVWGNISYNSCFSCVEKGVYVNAPANIITSGSVSAKYLTACMNSSIFNWEFKQKGIFLGKAYEWKKQYVELIHLPTITSSNQSTVSKIESFVDQILKIKKQDPEADTTGLEGEIDELVYGLYELTSEEIAVVKGSIKS